MKKKREDTELQKVGWKDVAGPVAAAAILAAEYAGGHGTARIAARGLTGELDPKSHMEAVKKAKKLVRRQNHPVKTGKAMLRRSASGPRLYMRGGSGGAAGAGLGRGSISPRKFKSGGLVGSPRRKKFI